MFTLKQVVVLFILQNTVYSFCFDKDYCLSAPYSSESTNSDELQYSDGSQNWDENENSKENSHEYSENNSNGNPENNLNGNSENKLNKVCPVEGYSLISHSDLKYLIEEKADILKIKENLVNSYYPVAEEILKKYVGELAEFQEKFNNRPEHMLHILHDIVLLRQELEPDLEEIATQLQKMYTLEDDIKDEAKRSAIMLTKLEKYKSLCDINCEEISIENRFGHKIDKNPIIFSQPAARYCLRVKYLNDIIHKKLSEVQAQQDKGLNQQLEVRDKMYAEKIKELKNNLKQAAVKQFGMIMYDILSLQDEYHHFVKDLKHVNISSETYNIEENIAEIGFRLIGLKRDLEKYRQYCMKCNMNQRVKRNVFELLNGRLDGVEELSVIPIEKIADAEMKSVDELINVTIAEITESIASNFTRMFDELDEKLNNPDVIDVFVTQLHPIQNQIENDIEMEQEALRRLSSRIPEASIDKILALSKESKQIIQNLEAAKQFIDQFITTNFR